MKTILVLLLFLSALLGADGIYEIARPPFSDDQLRENLVDTWEVHALTTVLLLGILLTVVFTAMLFLLLERRRMKFLSLAMACIALAAACTQVVSYVVLSNQVTRATGKIVDVFERPSSLKSGFRQSLPE